MKIPLTLFALLLTLLAAGSDSQGQVRLVGEWKRIVERIPFNTNGSTRAFGPQADAAGEE